MAIEHWEGLHIMMIICCQLMAIEYWEGLHIIEYRTLGVYVFSADGYRTLGQWEGLHNIMIMCSQP